MKRIFTLLGVVMCAVGVASASPSSDKSHLATYEQSQAVAEIDTLTTKAIGEVDVVARMPKQHFGLRKQAISSSVITSSMLESEHITSVKELSAIVPNFYQPDYGSKMTSSIYVRGFGARIDQPVIGMTVDGIPYLNKNNYDFDMLDIARVELLRGPQGTLYGRNTMGGQMNVYSLSPLDYQGVRVSAEYGSGNTLRGKASYYGISKGGKFAYSVAGYYNRTDGFFENEFDGSNVDWAESSGGRVRTIWQLGRGWEIDNVASVGYNDEGGYAYSKYNAENNIIEPINYNSPSGYMRLSVNDGLVVSYTGDNLKFTSTTSYQYMSDKMRMDQDFLPESYFTLVQQQREHAFAEDLVLRSNDMSHRWQWVSGLYGFYKTIDMAAPVTFLEDGISSLILGNMPDAMKRMLQFEEPQFDINSNFDIPTYGLALYHESSLRAGERWRFTAGLRWDYEASKMEYDNYSAISYRMMPMIPAFRKVEMPFKGEEKLDYLELLPKFAVNFTTGVGDLYATVTRGYKAGGFNTQIFSDILQNKMKSALMEDAMTAMGRPSTTAEPSPYVEASVTTYDPEYSWNYELGGHLQFAEGRVGVDFAAFWIECRDQQLTVFPDGLTTGRMMSNAGKSRSKGAEVSMTWRVVDGLSLVGNYGYTNAKFVEFSDGVNDYAGNYLPYAPQHTASAGVSYRWAINRKMLDALSINCSWQGMGKIYWNEANSLSQDFYSQLNASVELQKGPVSLSLWGRNLTNTDFYTFYFKSIGNSFYNHGKPCRVGITLGFVM